MFSLLIRFMSLSSSPYITFGGNLIGIDKGNIEQLLWVGLLFLQNLTFILIFLDEAAKSWVIDSGPDPNGMTKIDLFDSAANQVRCNMDESRGVKNYLWNDTFAELAKHRNFYARNSHELDWRRKVQRGVEPWSA